MDKRYSRAGIISPILIAAVIMVAVIGGLLLWQVGQQKNRINETTQTNSYQTRRSNTKSAQTLWRFDGQKWQGKVATGFECNDSAPLTSTLSQDLKLATARLYPGQVRGNDYKAHGGLLFDNSTNAVTINLPVEATLFEASRYLEMGEEQILVDLQTDCGWMLRFDHLAKVGPELSSIIATLPSPQPDQSQTHNLQPLRLKAGTVMATEIGFKSLKRSTVDFGLYNLKQSNQVSQSSAWQTAHADQSQLGAYGVCWFDYLIPADQTLIKALPAGDSTMGAKSDYCQT